MVCKHAKGDPNCSSTPGGYADLENQKYQRELREQNLKSEKDKLIKFQKELEARTPNPNVFDIVEFQEVGNHLVLMVQYTSCSKCSFDSKKVMCFLNTSLKDVIFWKKIDPHFSDTTDSLSKTEAPSPKARFPADKEGWDDAIQYLKIKPLNKNNIK